MSPYVTINSPMVKLYETGNPAPTKKRKKNTYELVCSICFVILSECLAPDDSCIISIIMSYYVQLLSMIYQILSNHNLSISQSVIII